MRKFLLASVATLGTGGLMGAAFAQAPAGTAGRRADAGSGGLAAGQPVGIRQHQQQLSGAGTSGSAGKPYAGHHRDPHGRQGADHLSKFSGAALTSAPSSRPPALRRAAHNGHCAGPGGGIVGATVTIADRPPGHRSRHQRHRHRQARPVLLEQLHAALLRRRRHGDERAALRRRDRTARELPRLAQAPTPTRVRVATLRLETVFVRRAFTYVASENWGLVRIGQADGVIGIFDNGVTTRPVPDQRLRRRRPQSVYR